MSLVRRSPRVSVQALLPLVLLAVVAYFLILRPTRKRAQAATQLQASLTPGDEVMLTSGIFGTVVDVADETAHIELAPGLVVRVHRGAVGQIVVDRPAADESDDDVPRT